MFVRYWLTFCDVAVALGLGVDVGEDVIGIMHPAARIAASVTTTNVPARNNFFMVNPRRLFTAVVMLVLDSVSS